MSDIKIVALVTGQEVMGKVSFDSNEKTWSIQEPVHIGFTQNDPNQPPKVGMAVFLPFGDKGATIKINEDKVLFVYEPSLEIANQYRTNFGSGIVLPNVKIGDISNTPIGG